jgi:endonuclease/exonuclease/phosphatase family metal-dependent hydrolase
MMYLLFMDCFGWWCTVAERRPGKDREDGMAVLVKKEGGVLDFQESHKILTGPERIAQLVQCRDRKTQRTVLIANTHLSFPGSPDLKLNQRRQACEALLVTRALSKLGRTNNKSSSSSTSSGDSWVEESILWSPPRLEVIGGDFNSNSHGLAAHYLESPKHEFVNCASASAEQALTSGAGGRVNLGVTHFTHRGEDVSVDHIFARVASSQTKPRTTLTKTMPTNQCSALRMGYLDALGTQVVDCQRGELAIHGKSLLSDHRPVTATFHWPHLVPCVKRDDTDTSSFQQGDKKSSNQSEVYLPLDPLQPPWGG